MKIITIHVLPALTIALLVACGAVVSEGEIVTPPRLETERVDATPELTASQPEMNTPMEQPEANTGTPLKKMESEMTELTITTGTYFGECFGICADTLTISSKKMHFENFTTPVNYSRPENVDERETKPSEWGKIVAHIDADAFRKIPDQIGDPDASDMGGEFVEIVSGDFSKRVDFEFGASLPEINDLLDVLRELRTEFSNQYR